MASAKENTPETAAFLPVTHHRDRLILIEIALQAARINCAVS
jgi:hypothetical protein